MGLKILHNGMIADFSGSKHEPRNLGVMRLNIRTSSGDTGIKRYGLATSAEQTSDTKLKLNVNGRTYYIGTSAERTSQSNYTTYSSYYTYTYTQTYTQTNGQTYTQSYTQTATGTYRQTYARNSVMTRQGTRTTATRTQPARYTYRASYYNGFASYYTAQSNVKYDVQTAYLSGTRSSGYNTTRTASRSSGYTYGYSYLYEKATTKLSYSWKASHSNALFKNYSQVTSYAWSANAAEYAGQSRTTYGTGNNYNVGAYVEHFTNTRSATGGAAYVSRGKTTSSWTGVYYGTTSSIGAYFIDGKTTLTSTRSSAYNSEYSTTKSSGYSSVAPNYVWLGASVAGNYGNWATFTVAAANYKTAYSTDYYSEGHVANQSYRRVSRHRTTALYGSTTARTGAATLTSTATPIGGVPASYTLSAGPSQISSAASYTYTDAGCTQTYASNYSTSYWTVSSTLTSTRTNTNTRTLTNTLTNTYTGTYNSSPWYRSSLGSTATSRVSNYTAHNFV